MYKILSYTLLIISSLLSLASGQNIWTPRNPLPTGEHLIAVEFANNTYVMTGMGGTILTSHDGESWTRQVSGTNEWLVDIAWGDSLFVIAGYSGSILTSPDGQVWTRHESGTRWISCLCSNGKKIVAATYDTILTSYDGLTWEKKYAGTGSIYSLFWGKDKFIASGYQGSFTSPDGINWTKIPDTNLIVSNIMWADNQFIAIGHTTNYPRNSIYTSPDGISWNCQIQDTSLYIHNIFWNGKKFFADGMADHDTRYIFTSENGKEWSKTESDIAGMIECVKWDGTRFIAGGDGGNIYISSDGINWEKEPKLGITERLCDVAWGKDCFVAVGWKGTIVTSPDGINWKSRVSGTDSNLLSVLWNNNKFTAFGSAGTILTSSDGITWENHSTDSSLDIGNFIWDNSQYVALTSSGDTSYIMTSDNSVLWEKRYSSSNKYLYGPFKCGSKLFVTGAQGTILTSDDGKQWTEQASGTNNIVMPALWNGKQFVCYVLDSQVVETEKYLVSDDAVHWTSHPLNPGFNIFMCCVINANGRFYVGGDDTPIISSTDGITWKEEVSGTQNYVLAFADNGSTMVAVGDNGIITSYTYSTGVKEGKNKLRNLLKVSMKNGVISYETKHSGNVTVDLYNINGSLIISLAHERLSSGAHSIRFPSHLAFGRYVVSIKADNGELNESILFTER